MLSLHDKSTAWLAAALVVIVGLFFLNAYLVQITYNNSVPKMNANWKPINYPTTLTLVIFVVFLGLGCRTTYYVKA